MNEDTMFEMMTRMMGPWWFLGWILAIGLIVLTIMAVVWVVRRSSGTTKQDETPLDILKRRLAQGEISQEEYETIRRQLDRRGSG